MPSENFGLVLAIFSVWWTVSLYKALIVDGRVAQGGIIERRSGSCKVGISVSMCIRRARDS